MWYRVRVSMWYRVRGSMCISNTTLCLHVVLICVTMFAHVQAALGVL